MRILVVTQYFWPENFRINDWVDGMVERGHHVTVLTSLPNYPKGILDENYKKNPELYKKYKQVNVIRVPQIMRGNNALQLFFNYISFALFGAIIGSWKLRKEKFDVSFVFAVSPILMVIPAIVIKFTKKVPILLWVLDLWPDVLKSIGVIKSKHILYCLSKFVAFLYNRCDAVVAQSSMFFEDIKSLVPRHKNLDFIPSWSDVVSNNYNSDNEIDLKISKLKGEFNIFYTGNIGEAQDFKTIIQAAKILKNEVTIKWFIIGDGRMLEWVKKEVLVNELENTFYLLGAYPIDKMAIFFKHADAGLLCLKNDDVLCKTIPGKLQTYYANNILVVGACNGEVFNIVNNSNSGLICNAGDSQKMAENILFLKSQSKEFLNNLSLNAKRFYENNYEREHVFKMFDDKLKSIIKKSL